MTISSAVLMIQKEVINDRNGTAITWLGTSIEVEAFGV